VDTQRNFLLFADIFWEHFAALRVYFDMNTEPSPRTVATPPPAAAAASTPSDSSRPQHASAPLPNDVAVLQAMIRELLASLKQTQRDRDGLQQRLDLLLRKLYGPKAERFDPNQPWLLPEMAPDAAANHTPTPTPTPTATNSSPTEPSVVPEQPPPRCLTSIPP
jgi:hypothetical protein